MVPSLSINRMTSSMKPTTWSHKNIVTKAHLGTIQYNSIVIGKEILAYFYVIAIITPKRGDYTKASLRFAKQTTHKRLLCFFIRWMQPVILVTQIFGNLAFLEQLTVIVCIIQHLTLHLLLFGHLCQLKHLICQLGQELYTHKTYVVFIIVRTKSLHGHGKTVSL